MKPLKMAEFCIKSGADQPGFEKILINREIGTSEDFVNSKSHRLASLHLL